MFRRIVFISILWTCLVGQPELAAQATLPNFTVTRLSDDQVLLQWKNPDTALRQLSIQQSADSLTGFRTLLTMPDASTPENGTVINRPAAGKMFYRLYLMYPRGRFVFTTIRRPAVIPPATRVQTTLNPTTAGTIVPATLQRPVPYEPGRSAVGTVPPIDHLIKPDSVARTRPQLGALPKLTPGKGIEVKKPTDSPDEPNSYVPSLNVYTHRDGYVFIQLPESLKLAEVQLRFFTETRQFLFELNHPTLRAFRIDKTNFYQSGWFQFEIWQKGKLIESNRFFIPLEF